MVPGDIEFGTRRGPIGLTFGNFHRVATTLISQLPPHATATGALEKSTLPIGYLIPDEFAHPLWTGRRPPLGFGHHDCPLEKPGAIPT
jgi:hypothetical protein